MRHEVSLNRQVEKDIALLERLQKERRAQSTSLDATESDEDDADDAPTREPVSPDDESSSDSAMIALPLDECTADESLDAVVKHSNGYGILGQPFGRVRGPL